MHAKVSEKHNSFGVYGLGKRAKVLGFRVANARHNPSLKVAPKRQLDVEHKHGISDARNRDGSFSTKENPNTDSKILESLS